MSKVMSVWSGRARVLALLLLVGLAGCGAKGGTITPVTTPPVSVSVSPAVTSVAIGGFPASFTASVQNASNTSVTWEVNGVAGGSSQSGTISAAGAYMSPAAMPSSPTITITARTVEDPTKFATASVDLTAAAAETVSVSPQTASVVAGGAGVTFTGTVTNATNTAVTWQVNGTTGGNATVGTITTGGVYTPPATVPAQPNVSVTAVSVADPTKTATATVTVTATQAQPVTVTVTPATANVALGKGTQTFSAAVTNTTNTAVTWQVNGTVGGSASVGTISTAGVYTAPAGLPTTNPVTITAVSVADATKSATASVTLTISAPTISGTPATSVVVGQVYDFKPTATDPNGLPLTFSITGKPAWATFSTTTGELKGTPAAANVGSSTITISASNGTLTASLPSFNLAVVQATTGSVTLNWVLPTLRTDGTALTNLASFKIYYGTSPTNLTNTMAVTNPTVTSAVVQNLTSGTWYFSITAIDSTGVESAKTNPASTTI